jgi:pSer/pThr/pTyr-binding forkhead associated (FHA) protein
MRLMAERGGQIGQVAIGRKPENDLAFPNDSSVSSQHCILIWNGSRLIVRDMGSSNGTYVNGVRLAGDLPVESGDVIAIGQSEFRLTVPRQSI